MKKRIIWNITLLVITCSILVLCIIYSKINNLDSYYEIGFLTGFLIVVIIGLINNIRKKEDAIFDERQLQARGESYKYSYISLIICLLLDGIIREFFEIKWANYFTSVCIWILVSCLIFVVFAIINDAYETINNQKKTNYIVLLVLGIINLLISIMSMINKEFIENNELTSYSLNFFCGVMITTVGIVGLIKKKLDTKKECDINEES